MAKSRKKKRTHSFVIRAGGSQKHAASLAQLVKDMRRVMEPNTASNIKERKGNKLKDFVHVAGLLGVSHLVMFSTTESAAGAKIGLRIGRMPRGPTLFFNVKQYVLTKDVLASQLRPKSPGSDFKCSPLVVLNNFNDPAKHVKLMATMFQNMFPPINVQTMKLTDARRILLFNLDSESGEIQVRHYSIGVKAIGISKSVKSLIQTNIPDLNKFQDVSDYVLKSAFASESDVEDGPESTVTLSQKYVGRGNNAKTASASAANSQRAVKLVELGPRLQLRLVKITEGLCGGEVLHHEFVKKTTEEVAELKQKVELKAKEKAERRAQQEKNVDKKKGKLDASSSSSSAAAKRKRVDGDDDGDDDDDSDGGGEEADDEDDDGEQEYEFDEDDPHEEEEEEEEEDA
ncbi:Brix domain-containing protein [Obelidium mucronatum]|nr:Brix domain-containing protein [Obelidium mucronatum]